MPEDYTIEQLEKTFKEHSKIYEKEWMTHSAVGGKNYFNIYAALHVICREINQINRAINILEKGVILPENWGKLRD